MSKFRIPHKIRAGAVRELADGYKNPFAYSRETGSNAYDQSQHPDSPKTIPYVTYAVSKLRRTTTIEDDRTGIKDMEDFTAIGTETTDRDSGKIVGDVKSSYVTINPNIVGQKHVGKLSCLNASETGNVEYYSNNGKNGHYLHMDYDGWEMFEYDLPFQTLDKNDALPHIGLRIIINDMKAQCLNIRALEKHLSNWFGLLLSKKKIRLDIFDSDNPNRAPIHVKALEDLDTKGEKTDDTLKMSKGGNIRVNLVETDQPSLGPNIRIYHKEIFVCELHFPYMVKGYINWNGFELSLYRESYKDDPEFEEVFNHYLAMHFPREYIPDMHKTPIAQKEKKQLEQVITEVFTAISHVHADLLPKVIGFKKESGIPGIAQKPPQENEKKKPDYVTVRVTYTDEETDEDIISTGTGTDGGGGGKRRKKGKEDPNGIYTGKKQKPEDDEPDIPQLVMPDIEVNDTGVTGMPTLFFKEIPIGEGKTTLVLTINAFCPASSALRKSGSIERQRDTFYDKLIRAAYALTYKGNDINELEYLVDETWNSLYGASHGEIQKQTKQMMGNVSNKSK
jgi:hypothetical protein